MRTKDEICTEIKKVELAKDNAERKIDRCMKRLDELYNELSEAYDDTNS